MELVLGAGGFVGRRIVAELMARGRPVRGLARTPGALSAIAQTGAEAVEGDLLDPQSLAKGFAGVRVVYYLVHSLREGEGLKQRDVLAVEHVLARASHVDRIVYVGGLGSRANSQSVHLHTRYDVENRICAGPVPFTAFRASMIIGRGGASFEVVRDVVRSMPVIPSLGWRRTKLQPIGIYDLVRYCVEAPLTPASANRVFDVGCDEIVTYADLLSIVARLMGKRRLLVPFPGFWPRASALALRFISDVHPQVVRGLIPVLREPMLVRNREADEVFGFIAAPLEEALRRALAEYDHS